MKRMIRVLVPIMLAAWISGCSLTYGNNTKAATVSPATTLIPPARPTAAVTSEPSPTFQPTRQRTQYVIDATLDYAKKQARLDETILYTNRSDDPLQELDLVVEPNLQEGVFELELLTWGDDSPVENASLAKQRLIVPLKSPLMPGGQITLKLRCAIVLSATAGVLSFEENQVNLAGWYPYVAPYVEGRGFIIHDPAKVGEYQVYELADFKVDFDIEGAPEGFMLAASSRGTLENGVFHFEANDVRNFTLSGSNEYRLLEAYAGNVRVRAFVFPYDLEAGQAALDTAVQALQLYSSLFGAYTHDSLTIVEAMFTDGMEYDGLSFVGQEYFNNYHGGADSYLVAITAHETAHQWWYAMITNDQAYDPWLDEALCTFTESLFYRNVHPDLVDWWWQTRVNYYAPSGWVDSTIYDFDTFRPYVNAVYLRGASFLGDLQTEMGDDEFLAFMRDYFTTIHDRADQDSLGLATTAEFWSTLQRHTAIDFELLKRRYFAQP